ncbi:hypothetical protein CXB77_00110 [Chromatium okenii]|uniref:Uncharacterized protein n=1 Tax=Chromatium okenii TaxID=61644 RepID=A0A2S7XW85_9GAMM|nr:hypothetical protein CXB77_00110 [Chromatium okenii]
MSASLNVAKSALLAAPNNCAAAGLVSPNSHNGGIKTIMASCELLNICRKLSSASGSTRVTCVIGERVVDLCMSSH